MADIIVIIILVLLIGNAVTYMIRARKSGVKCIGCPAGGSCSGSRQTPKKKLSGSVVGKKTIAISGMQCQNCVNSVTKALNGLDGVAAKVNLNNGMAEVSCDREVDEADLKRAVEAAGFKVVNIS
ncbi:MAG TPA: heavy-metal-associated domain-containing protein [Candidatus Mediterraneibacter intestinipullorum]|nr:heavy-metal-associated domain-containing protein [Candidatus Mediterraneibacter intestinipullorum]